MKRVDCYCVSQELTLNDFKGFFNEIQRFKFNEFLNRRESDVSVLSVLCHAIHALIVKLNNI